MKVVSFSLEQGNKYTLNTYDRARFAFDCFNSESRSSTSACLRYGEKSRNPWSLVCSGPANTALLSGISLPSERRGVRSSRRDK